MKEPRWTNKRNVCKRYHASDSSVSRWVKAGVFPAPARIGLHTDRWDENELDEYDADPEGWKAKNGRQEEAAA